VSGTSSLRVALPAQITPGVSGGIAQFTMSLVRSLGKLNDGPEEYIVVVESREPLDWLKSFAGPNQRFLVRDRSTDSLTRRLMKRAVKPLRPAATALLNHFIGWRMWPEVPISDGFYESLGCDVIHFPFENFVLCAIPTVTNIHDLQHLHYPQFFKAEGLAWREVSYPAACQASHTVVVGSQWAKDDLVRHYGVHPDKVQVVPEAPPTEFHAEPSPGDVAKVKQKYQLEQPFALYPAVTWPHKNHLRMLEVLAQLRDSRGLTVRLVCTGSPYPSFWPKIQARVNELKLGSQVQFLGFVPDLELRAIYRLSQFLVLPTLFEASSLPIYEAWSEGVPVASANVTALPDQAMGAALLFDPHSTASMAEAIVRMATDETLREELRQRGRRRLEDFDSERTAKAYRAVYRRAARAPLTEEDCELLSWDWMKHPRRKLEVKL